MDEQVLGQLAVVTGPLGTAITAAYLLIRSQLRELGTRIDGHHTRLKNLEIKTNAQ